MYGGVRTDVAAKRAGGGVRPDHAGRARRHRSRAISALDHELPERLDALVNNAAVAVAGPVETLSRGDMHRQFDVNVLGPLALTRALLPRLRLARGRAPRRRTPTGREIRKNAALSLPAEQSTC